MELFYAFCFPCIYCWREFKNLSSWNINSAEPTNLIAVELKLELSSGLIFFNQFDKTQDLKSNGHIKIDFIWFFIQHPQNFEKKLQQKNHHLLWINSRICHGIKKKYMYLWVLFPNIRVLYFQWLKMFVNFKHAWIFLTFSWYEQY